MAGGEGHDFVFFFRSVCVGFGKRGEEEEEGVVINIQKEVRCNECSFCGFALRKIDNDMESSFLSLSLYLSSHLLYVPDEQV